MRQTGAMLLLFDKETTRHIFLGKKVINVVNAAVSRKKIVKKRHGATFLHICISLYEIL